MPEHPDLLRLRDEYAERARRYGKTDHYSLFNPGQLFAIQQRQRAVLRRLRRNSLYPLLRKDILELGPGSGGVLLEFLSFGASAQKLHGAELLFDRAQSARQSISNLLLACADGQYLPYPSQRFDLALQFTVFSSILDDKIKANIAGELLRVTRPGGMILWYDFWLNPTNPQTRGIRPDEIRQLFPNCMVELQRITLAPPLASRIVPFSWGLALFLESLKIFNTHYLAAIRPINRS
jgi:ubiquinone/menaquinone biosynthesis C-methylase UbiE